MKSFVLAFLVTCLAVHADEPTVNCNGTAVQVQKLDTLQHQGAELTLGVLNLGSVRLLMVYQNAKDTGQAELVWEQCLPGTRKVDRKRDLGALATTVGGSGDLFVVSAFAVGRELTLDSYTFKAERPRPMPDEITVDYLKKLRKKNDVRGGAQFSYHDRADVDPAAPIGLELLLGRERAVIRMDRGRTEHFYMLHGLESRKWTEIEEREQGKK